ncbi:hypothetical protein SCMU_28730 [Sinomonas cyclohexanicum]|uniref:Repeat domain-containing protein n=1 Tax=Sinomonas cyclohexanicum TaxID=322009 RepID=A0ABM7PXK8_SINCY|nr:FG-GAP-like repeat-containing protein [Corynebacterium cyclohexanicum]BCT77031.1 hypothetical protein SCMU_28730 [Corynebacterium cyclohexanicum]
MHWLFPRSGASARPRRFAAVVLSALLAAMLLAPASPASAADGAVLTGITPPSTAVVPGQPAYISFSGSVPLESVYFKYQDELGRDSLSAVWGQTTAGPQAVVYAPSTALTGTHRLVEVQVYGTVGNGSSWYSRGAEPAGSVPLSMGDLEVENPSVVLRDFVQQTPTIVADTQSGLRLTVRTPGPIPTGTTFAYQWYRDGQAVPGATGAEYRPAFPADGGATMTVTLAGTAPNYRPATFTSAPYGPVARTVHVAPIVMAGLPAVGGVLHPEFQSEAPVWVDPAGGVPSYAYTWKRDGAPIPGADQALYAVSADDAYRTLSVDLTVSYDGGASATTVSTRAVRITAAPRTRGFDADGTADVFARTADGTLMLYPGDGRGGWKPARAIGWGWGGFDALVAPGDFDGDGATDVIARDGSGRLFLYSGDGAGGWKGGRQIGQGWGGFLNLVAAGDVNGDGTNDLVARDASAQMWLYPGDGRGGWLAPSVIGWGWWDYSGLTSTGDFNGDLATDVVGIDKYAILRLFPTNGQGGFGANAGAPIGTDWRGLAYVGGPGDFNGDGDADLFAVDGAGRLTMYWGNAGLKGRFYGAVGDWKGASTVGWGWGGFTAVF